MRNDIAFTTITLAREWIVAADGMVLPVVRGADGDPPAGDPPPADPPATGGTFTQEQVNAIAAAERRKAEDAASRKLTEALGMTPEEAKAAIVKATEAERAAMTEADRKLAEAADRESKAEAREQAAAVREHYATLKATLLEVGVAAKKVAGAAKLIDVALDADEATIATAVEAFKVEWPEFFAAADPNAEPPKPPPSGNPPGNPPPAGGANKNNADALTRGAERAKKENERRNKGVVQTAGSSL